MGAPDSVEPQLELENKDDAKDALHTFLMEQLDKNMKNLDKYARENTRENWIFGGIGLVVGVLVGMLIGGQT